MPHVVCPRCRMRFETENETKDFECPKCSPQKWRISKKDESSIQFFKNVFPSVNSFKMTFDV